MTKSLPLFVAGALWLWVILSPIVWHAGLTARFRIDIPLWLMLQPFALAVVAVSAMGGWWMRWPHVRLGVCIAACSIAASLVLSPSVVGGGVILNACALIGASLLAGARE